MLTKNNCEINAFFFFFLISPKIKFKESPKMCCLF